MDYCSTKCLVFFSDEANFAYIIEALQTKKPATVEVESSATASHDPPPMLACSNFNGTASEDVQSVKELFPHLETSHIQVVRIDTVLCHVMPLLGIDC